MNATLADRKRSGIWLLYFIVCFGLLVVSAHAQSVPGGEQVETGQALEANGVRPYRIRLLPPTSFPDLPPAVASQLSARRCLIPQTFEARLPENVIHGSFAKKGSSDWGVLCSVHGETSLLVFFEGNPAQPYLVVTMKSAERLASETPAQPLGSAWGISTVSPGSDGKLPDIDQRGTFDHDGLKDEFVGQSATVRYFRDGKWQAFDINN